MATGILLIHGFTGRPEDFCALPARLAAECGAAAVKVLELPGHGNAQPPVFNADLLTGAVRAAADELLEAGLDLVVLGHSTGGTLALAALADRLPGLRLLVLVSTPKKIDAAYLSRWQAHATPVSAISFASLAGLVSLVNRTEARITPSIGSFPVLLVQGETDPLVPVSEVHLWEGAFSGPVRTVILPGAGHHPFVGGAADYLEDLLVRAVGDACHEASAEEREMAKRLIAAEPGAERFFSRTPGSLRHLAGSPSGLSLADRTSQLSESPTGEPVILNIEVTTRCNLRCAYCARTRQPGEERDMPVEHFRRILDLLPHGYRVTLVGLGEPLQHPEICTLVAEAARRGRRVALVTNALELTPKLCRGLLEAGIDAVTFSLDAAVQEVADQVRAGSDLELILANIQEFSRLADATRPVSRAVFSAVSSRTLPHLEQLVRTVATLGVDALMLSDLNFEANAAQAAGCGDRKHALALVRQAVRTGFSLGLPVLSVHGLEELGLAQRYTRHLLAPPSRLLERASRRTHCHSPWQTLPIMVDGSVSVCDCQPETRAGNLLRDPFDSIWRGPALTEQRRLMLGDTPPNPCRSCPRF